MTACSEKDYYYKLDNMILSATEYLQQVFRNRWKSETNLNWTGDLDHLHRILNTFGKRSLKTAEKNQKTLLEEWDITMLSAMVQNFGDETKYKHDNLAVRQLKEVRNLTTGHLNKRAISKDEFEKNEIIFRESLKSLGMSPEKIDKLIEMAGITSSKEAFETLQTFHTKAAQFVEQSDIDNAEKYYSDATQIPSLLAANLATAYEKRAEFYLNLKKDPTTQQTYISQALEDAKKALELNERSWKAHYILAQCHRFINSLSKAIHHYELALAISPAQIKVKCDMDSCKVLSGIRFRQDHLNPAIMPMNLKHRVEKFMKDNSLKDMTVEDFIFHEIYLKGALIPGQDHLFRGHMHFCGWGVSQSREEAARHYSKAAVENNPEGMYNLAACYHFGLGVEQDIEEAVRRYREVAEMSPLTLGQPTKAGVNVGVANAQFALGLLYENGVGVDMDWSEAARWYFQAMGNGVGGAANNLALLYAEGRGVPRDDEMAEIYWMEGVKLEDVNSPASLVTYYLYELEPDKAEAMRKIGQELGNESLSNMSDEEFDAVLAEKRTEREKIEPKVLELEKAEKLSEKGLTFLQRSRRLIRYNDPNLTTLMEIMETHSKGFHGEETGGQFQGLTLEMIPIIEEAAAKGSEIANRIMETIFAGCELNDLLEEKEEYSDEELLEILNLHYKCVTMEGYLVPIGSQSGEKLKKILKSFSESEKFQEKCEIDEKVRLCLEGFNLQGSATSKEDMLGLKLVLEGIQRYADNLKYYHFLSCLYGFKEEHESGKEWALKRLKLFPDNPDLLYNLATHLVPMCENHPEYVTECIATYKRFISKAPYDHRKVPEAFYRISSLEMTKLQKLSRRLTEEDLGLVEYNFGRGLEAEKKQLPCYLPYGQSYVRILVENIIHFIKFGFQREPRAELGIFHRKQYLGNSTRHEAIIIHRRMLLESNNQRKKSKKNLGEIETTSNILQKPAKRMSALKPITFQEMNTTTNQIYVDRYIELTIIDDPNPFFSCIALICEDDNGDVMRVCIYNADRTKETMSKFRFGCCIAIINPCHELDAIGGGIRNDEPSCLVYLESVENMCRFCGDEKASTKCKKCKRPYCSQECQDLDKKILEHDKICRVKYNSQLVFTN